MKFTRIVSVLAMAIALSACKTVDTPDGKIPSEYVGAAKAFEGTYSGRFDGMKGDLTLKIDGDMPVLTYTDSFGHDLLGKGCGSSIGKLKSVSISDSNTIDSADFELNTGSCAFEGRTLSVSISIRGNETEFNLSAVRDHFQSFVPGDIVCHGDAHGHEYCHQTPGHFIIHYNYARGSFKKTN